MDLFNNPSINETVKEAARFIETHPGCTGQEIADAIFRSHDHVRKSIVPVLKQLGFRNYRNRNGYFPPSKESHIPPTDND